MPDALMPEQSALLVGRIAFAIALGFLIGLERGWQERDEAEGVRLAGVRTYALYGAIGGIAGVMGDAIMLLAATVGAAILIAAGYFASLQKSEPDRGMTSEAAALATVLLGGLAGRGDMLLATAGAVLVVILLSTKRRLHALIGVIRRGDLTAGIRLLAISVLILPFLPDQGFGPAGVLNPRQIWWGVVIVAGLSFAGYVAVRALGTRLGPLAFGALGGLASSTAVTVTASRLARSNGALAPAFSTAIGLASAVMMVRVAVLTALFSPPLLMSVCAPLAVAAGSTIVVAAALHWLGRRAQIGRDALKMEAPDDLGFALTFGAMLAAIGLAVHFAKVYFGHAGLLAVAMLSGPIDVDAFTLSAARAADTEMNVLAARDAVLLCVAINTLGKVVIVFVLGGRAIGRRVALTAGVSVATGLAAWLAI